MKKLKNVFEHELKDLYRAENPLVKALPKLAKGAMNDELRQAPPLQLTGVKLQLINRGSRAEKDVLVGTAR